MTYDGSFAEKIVSSRMKELGTLDFSANHKREDEGGCGVTGFACTVPLAGRYIFEPSVCMHNRGNGKGGGIAAAGMNPDMLGVSREVLGFPLHAERGAPGTRLSACAQGRASSRRSSTWPMSKFSTMWPISGNSKDWTCGLRTSGGPLCG